MMASGRVSAVIKGDNAMRRINTLAAAAAGTLLATSAFAQSATTNLFLLEDVDDVSRTMKLAQTDLNALHAVADWIKTFVAKPHKDLGRAGNVCPFVPGALERKVLWLAPEQIAERSAPDVVQLINGYKRLFLGAQPIDGDD